MGESWNNMAPFLDKIYLGILIIMAVLLIVCLVRAVVGPLFSDRIVAANMMGTMVMVMIAVLALMLKEGYLLDICLLYALLSFLTVVVVSQTYLRAFLKRHVDKDTGKVVETVKEDDENGNN